MSEVDNYWYKIVTPVLIINKTKKGRTQVITNYFDNDVEKYDFHDMAEFNLPLLIDLVITTNPDIMTVIDESCIGWIEGDIPTNILRFKPNAAIHLCIKGNIHMDLMDRIMPSIDYEPMEDYEFSEIVSTIDVNKGWLPSALQEI